MTRHPPGPCPLCGGPVVVQTSVRATGLGASLQARAVACERILTMTPLLTATRLTAGPIGHLRLRTPVGSLWLGWGPPALLAYASRSGAGVFVGPVSVHVTISEARPRVGGW